jgi:hypothetical protein
MPSETPQDFLCSICNERHIISTSYSIKVPAAALAIPKDEADSRIVITPDQCVIDQRNFYIRGRIPIPIHGSNGDLAEPFIWGVWVEVSPKNFIRTNELWNTPGRENEPPFPGYLNSEIPIFGATINLKVDVQTQPVGRRPHFFIKDLNHPFASEQREGISLERLQEIAEQILHPETVSPQQ